MILTAKTKFHEQQQTNIIQTKNNYLAKMKHTSAKPWYPGTSTCHDREFHRPAAKSSGRATFHSTRWTILCELHPSFILYDLQAYIYKRNLVSVSRPSVLWRCSLGVRKGIWPVKMWLMRCWCGYPLERSANSLHTAQQMPLQRVAKQ